jgi:SAM-dependent methyltransferase
MTHLDWPVQKKWLAEIRRLLRPGGVFAASVHGWFAAAFFPGARDRLRERHGFFADDRDKSLDGIAPRGYYRSAFQTEAFTRTRWSEELPVVDYGAAGLAGFQDLVVARRGA